ncbi:MAG TPA: bifunctional phosphoglucose/phosphomannose isomerase [Acidobacteriota bacterium]|nr:bifunctional phosphoglucose/phosphomannose isomerase [Acidobacteriota bacterium]
MAEGSLNTILDQPGRMSDSKGQSIFESLRQFGHQLRSGPSLAASLESQPLEDVTSVVYCGLGGSAIAGDLLQAVLGDSLSLPWLVHRDYGLPAFAGPGTLALVSSYSGDTEETLDAFRIARRRGCSMVCVSSGGRLLREAKRHDIPRIQLPSGLAPRNSLGFALSSLLSGLHRLGLTPDPGPSLQEAADAAAQRARRLGLDTPLKENPAKHLARRLQGRMVIIYGSAGLTFPVARRWRGQINENSKQLAWAADLPEMNHNEVAGWEHPSEMLKQVAAVFLRDQDEHPRIAKRFDITRRYIQDKAGDTLECDGVGGSRLDRMLSLVQLVDWASVYLAILNDADPESIEAIDSLKQRMQEDD